MRMDNIFLRARHREMERASICIKQYDLVLIKDIDQRSTKHESFRSLLPFFVSTSLHFVRSVFMLAPSVFVSLLFI